ncbi:MAG: type VII secretion protein EssC [Anaerolineales bacterium]
MSRDTSVRRGQRKPPPLPTETVKIPRYPNEPSPPDRMSWWLVVAPAFGMMAMAIGIGFISRNFLYPIIIMSVAFVYPSVMLLRRREARKRWEQERSRIRQAYEKRIAQVEHQLEATRDQQITFLRWTHPEPKELGAWSEKGSERLWERRSGDADFLNLRVGIGDTRASYEVDVPPIEIPELAPELLVDARNMGLGFRKVANAPLSYDLRKHSSLGVTGPRRLREGFARAFISGLATLHAPDDLALFAVLPSKGIAEWNWLKWLPHTHAIRSNSSMPRLAYDPSSVSTVISGLLDELEARRLREPSSSDDFGPFLLMLVADDEAVRGEAAIQRLMTEGSALRAGLVILSASSRDIPPGIRGRLEIINEKRANLYSPGRTGAEELRPDQLGAQEAELLARGLAPLELADSQTVGDLPDQIRLMELIGNPDVKRLDLESRWLEALSRTPSLEVPIGMRHGSRQLVASLKQSGQGPHGLIAGTTGSGKSELLLTLLSGLALANHPHQVNFVLVDYKGGTAMSVLSDLPHTVGVVTDLDGKQTRRALVALRSELTRREEILARHQVADVDKFHELGISEHFPYLFIVIDEFAELKERFKHDLGEILNEFVSVAQKGRALGVHLILAMQRPEGVVNESIRANMRFRICLRVERAEDSRNVLGRPDAYLLPSQPPGRAYFQVGNDEQFDLFQVARVAGFYQEDREVKQEGPVLIQEVAPDGRRIKLFEVEAATPKTAEPKGRVLTEAQILVKKAVQAAEELGIERLKSPWPPPLPKELPLENLFELAEHQHFDGERWPEDGSPGSGVPVGLLDEPALQRQIPLMIDFQEDGNLLVIGSPGSGRTVALMTLVAANAQSHPPGLIHFHLIDFGGHQLKAAFGQMPHVAGTYSSNDVDHVRRLLSNLRSELDTRRRLFESAGVVDFARYREGSKESGELPAILTIINDFSGLQEAFSSQLDEVIGLLREGGDYGLYFALSSDRFPTGKVADLISRRIALRIADRMMYSVILDGRPDFSTHDPVPGRGFYSTKPPIEIQLALPTSEAPARQIHALQELSSTMSRAWEGPKPAPVRMLSESLSLAQVLHESRSELSQRPDEVQSWFAIEDMDLTARGINLSRVGSYFLITGPPESGKTTALASIGLTLGVSYDPSRVQFALVTPKRGEQYRLDALNRVPHCMGQAKTDKTLTGLLAVFEEEAESRLTAEPEELRKSARLLLLLDDYHLLSTRMGAEMLSRLESLAQKSVDIRLTIILTAPSTVLSTMADPLIRHARSWRNGIWLKTTDALESNIVGVKMPIRLRGKELPPGRGFLYDPGGQDLIQLATPELAWETQPEMPSTLDDWVSYVIDKSNDPHA